MCQDVNKYCLVKFVYRHTCTYQNMMTYQPGSVPCGKSAGTFSRLFVTEPTYEGDKGGHIGPVVIDVSYTNHVCGACSAGNLALFSSIHTHTHTHVGLNMDFCLFVFCSVKGNGHESLLFLLYVISNIVEFKFDTLTFGTLSQCEQNL